MKQGAFLLSNNRQYFQFYLIFVAGEQGVRVANWVRELIIGIETFRDGGKPKYAINRTILDKNFHKQLILGMYWQRGAMKHP